MKLRRIIAANVELLRKDRELSQEQLAKMLKVNKQTIWRLEKGSTNVGVDTLEALAKALRVEPYSLLVDRAKSQQRNGQTEAFDQALVDLDRVGRVIREYRDNRIVTAE